MQHKILQIIFDSDYATYLSFLGGTCLRIVHGNTRFSEDLDFDNFGLGEDIFENIATHIQNKLTQEGYILLAQKFYALLNRQRNKGRDFFDVVFILSKIDSPNYDYLSLKANISNAKQLKEKVLEKCSQINLEEMAKDVQPFLFDPTDAKKVILFADYIKQIKFK